MIEQLHTAEHSALAASAAALIIGATGGIGNALLTQLQSSQRFATVLGCARSDYIRLDLLDESTIAHAAQEVAAHTNDLRLIIDATGTLHGEGCEVEKSWKQLEPLAMAKSFAINAIGPALIMKHFLPLLATQERSVFATLSARVGSIGDNQLGGWYSYRASKAALNQLMKTASIELRRTKPHAICVALHPGTVQTALSHQFVKSAPNVATPEIAAQRLLQVIENLSSADNGGFFDHHGKTVEW